MEENKNKKTETEAFCEQNKIAIADFATSYFRQGVITAMAVMASTVASAAVVNKIFYAIRIRKKK